MVILSEYVCTFLALSQSCFNQSPALSLYSLKSTVDEAWLSQSFTFGSKSVPLLLPLLSTSAGLTVQLVFLIPLSLKKVDESRQQKFSLL